MEKLIAYCGLICNDCPAYIATRNNDNAARAKIAEDWSKEYGSDIKPENINCNGCTSKGDIHLGYCQICEIRLCGVRHEVVNCAYCAEYPCEKLGNFFNMAPHAKTTLDGIRQTIA